MLGSSDRTVNNAPVVGLEQSPVIFGRYFSQLAVNRNCRVVHPRVEPAEVTDRRLSNTAYLLLDTYVGFDVDRASARSFQFVGECLQCWFSARDQDEFRAALCGHSRGHETNPARRA